MAFRGFSRGLRGSGVSGGLDLGLGSSLLGV